jgi:hypothetical protein
VGALRGQNFVLLGLEGGTIRRVGKKADLQLEKGVTRVGYGDGVGGDILHVAEIQNVLTALLDIYQSRCQ